MDPLFVFTVGIYSCEIVSSFVYVVVHEWYESGWWRSYLSMLKTLL